ncbi:nucleotide exchange factor GrpE, partial [Turicibacter sanguinis]|nr:nucleotide exchange factor GrpE [Turicibacter sanguinis]
MNKETQPVEELEELNEEAGCQEANGDCQCETESEVIDETVELKQQIQDLKDQLLRNAAELENFKRRMNEERVLASQLDAQLD